MATKAEIFKQKLFKKEIFKGLRAHHEPFFEANNIPFAKFAYRTVLDGFVLFKEQELIGGGDVFVELVDPDDHPYEERELLKWSYRDNLTSYEKQENKNQTFYKIPLFDLYSANTEIAEKSLIAEETSTFQDLGLAKDMSLATYIAIHLKVPVSEIAALNELIKSTQV